jgi:hypothetical protein
MPTPQRCLIGLILLGASLRPFDASGADLSKGHAPVVLDARIGANVRVGDDPGALPAGQRGQAEPHIVRSATNPNHLLAVFQDGRLPDAGALACGYAISNDGGFTWQRDLIPALTSLSGGRFNRATDPVAGAGPQGELYIQTLGSIQGAFAFAAIVVSRSLDGGTTWDSPATVFESTSSLIEPDKNWLAVNDFVAVPNAGRLVSTWTNFRNNASGQSIASPIVASLSDDRGTTWSAPIEITPAGSLNQGSQPVFLPDGSLAVVYVTFSDPNSSTQFAIHCKRSVDGGRTFPATPTIVVGAVNGWDDPEIRDGVFLPSAAVSRQSGELFVAYTAVFDGAPRVFVTKSSDQGATWSAPQAASDQVGDASVMNPVVAATPDGRSVSVVFMVKHPQSLVDHYLGQSFDGGTTWQPSLRLSEISSELRYATQTSRGAMFGDYLGLAPALGPSQPCVAIWCDTRTGDSDPVTVRFMPTPVADYAAWSAVRGLSPGTSHLDDEDRDGVPNYLEFIAGTDPKKPDAGVDLVVRVESPTALQVAWVERTTGQRTFGDGVAAVTMAFFDAGGFSTAGVAPASLPVDALPSTAAGEGLSWRGTRFTFPADTAVTMSRAYRFSAGLPVLTSAAVTASRTDSRLVNLSTRGATVPGNPLIVGFVLEGNKRILVRGAGPALTALGLKSALTHPRLTLSAPASDLNQSNESWIAGGATPADFARLGAFPFATASRDTALLMPLGPQAYTAALEDAQGGSGIGLLEAYDADPAPGAPGNSRLLNLSARGTPAAGDGALIAGFVLSGAQPRRVLLRAAGPALSALGVPGAMADPFLTVYQADNAVAANDDWQIGRSAAAIGATAQRVGAFPFPPGSLDAALLLTLAPGAYTAIVTSADGRAGLALIEIYDAD